MATFQAPILNSTSSITTTGVGQEEMERRRLALQQALASCLSADEMAHTVKLCEQEFAQKMSISISEFCQRLFETMPQIQLDKAARLRLLRAMRQPITNLAVENRARISESTETLEFLEPTALAEPMALAEPIALAEPMTLAEPIELTEPVAPAEPIPLSSPEDSTSPELFLVAETPPVAASPEDSTSPELFILRYANFGKEILG